MNAPTVSQVYISMFSNYLEQLQVNRPDCQFKSIRFPLVSASDFERFPLEQLEVLIADIAKATKNRAFGLDIGEQIHPSDYGILGYTLMNCSTLLQAAELVSRYASLLNQAFTIELEELEEFHEQLYFRLENDSNHPVSGILAELQLVSMVQMGRFLAGPQKSDEIWLSEVHFQHSPLADLQKYQNIFKCPVRFNQAKNQIVVAKTVLALPIRSASPKMLSMLLKKMTRIEEEMNNKVPFGRRVCDFIEHYISETGFPTAPIVAEHFNISMSTLKKHLHQESLNFTVICDEVKKNVAIKMVI